jgi:putative endonuclease
MADHNELGEKGEAIALDYLQKKGYRILTKNYRFKRWEVDIIAEKDEIIVVVEVKTRQSSFMAGPEITVTRAKQKSIVKTAHEFMLDQQRNNEVRFDIISIILNEKTVEIEHLEDAFYPVL